MPWVMVRTRISASGWRDGSMAKSTGWPCTGPVVGPQNPRGGSQPSVILVPGIQCPLLVSIPGSHKVHRHIGRQKTHIHKIKIK